MNKAEFVDYIAAEMETRKAEAGRFLEVFIEGIHTHVVKDKIRLQGCTNVVALEAISKPVLIG